MPTVRVAVSSPIAIVRAGLVALLESGGDRTRVVPLPRPGEVVGVGSAQVVLYDAIGLQQGDAPDLTFLLTRTPARVLVVSRDLRPDLASRALRQGAHGYVPMTVGPAALLDAVEGALGRSDRRATERAEREARLGRDVGLTPREVEVLTLITQGMGNAEIAAATYLSINSVKTYVRGAYRRIGVHNRSQAVIWCLQHGFATGPPPGP